MEEKARETKETYEEKLRRYEYFLKERNASVEAENATISSFEKTLTVLASGALGLSITFIRYIAPEPDFKEILFTGWVFFVISLLIILLSFLFSRIAQVKYRDIIEKKYENPKYEGKNAFGTITDISNWVSLISLIIGVILFATFAGLNF